MGTIKHLRSVDGGVRGRGAVVTFVGLAMFVAAAMRVGGAQTAEAPAVRPGDGYYTEVQAERGRVAFNRNCSLCHNADPKSWKAETGNTGAPSSFGGHFVEREWLGRRLYPSVFYLFKKLDTMPAFDTTSVSPAVKADILAYLLRQNGYPNGSAELRPDLELMKSMMLDGPGFERIFNGTDFTGLKFVIGPQCQPQPIGCGKTEPGTDLRVENGLMVCTCNIHGYWYTEKKYHDFTLRFEERFMRPSGWDSDDELFMGGGGTLLFVTQHRVWPHGIEVEGRYRDRLYIYDIGGKSKFTYDAEAKVRANKPMDQWSSIEIVSKNGQVKSYLNGTLVSTVTEHNYTEPGHIGFQMEGAPTYWRNIRIRPE
jgi:mono/diheme cytochrome c family protein